MRILMIEGELPGEHRQCDRQPTDSTLSPGEVITRLYCRCSSVVSDCSLACRKRRPAARQHTAERRGVRYREATPRDVICTTLGRHLLPTLLLDGAPGGRGEARGVPAPGTEQGKPGPKPLPVPSTKPLCRENKTTRRPSAGDGGRRFGDADPETSEGGQKNDHKNGFADQQLSPCPP